MRITRRLEWLFFFMGIFGAAVIVGVFLLGMDVDKAFAAEIGVENSIDGVMRQAARDFAAMRCPQFYQDVEVVESAFKMAFDGNKMNQEWFERFSLMVKNESRGAASVELIDGPPILTLLLEPYQVIQVTRGPESTTYVLMPSSQMGCEDDQQTASYSLLR